jgi:NAD(P)H-nitrite reductase large subunit
MATKKYDYLIIGNSAGGIGCIEGIRREDPKGKIAIVSDEKYHTYSRPLITHLLEGDVDRFQAEELLSESPDRSLSGLQGPGPGREKAIREPGGN